MEDKPFIPVPPTIQIVMGFDFGLSHIGIALGQVLTRTTQPYTSVSAYRGKPNWDQLKKMIEEWRPDALIVGIPIDLDGRVYEMTRAAHAFGKELHRRFSLPVYEADERLTSVEARSRLFEQGGYKSLRKRAIDSIAAQLIIENWLLSAYKV